jgi:hypothetical protein
MESVIHLTVGPFHLPSLDVMVGEVSIHPFDLVESWVPYWHSLRRLHCICRLLESIHVWRMFWSMGIVINRTFILLHVCYRSCFEWESTPRSIVALVTFIVLCYYFEPYMVPIALLLIFLKYYIVSMSYLSVCSVILWKIHTEGRIYMPCEFLTVVSMKMILFWNVALCSLIEIDQHFRGIYCLIDLMMEAASISGTSVNFYEAIWRNIPEDSHLHAVPCLCMVSCNIFSNIDCIIPLIGNKCFFLSILVLLMSG